MPIIDIPLDDFVEKQERRVANEISYWNEFRHENDEGIYLAFSEQKRDGNIKVPNNQIEGEREREIYNYLELPDVYEIDGILVDSEAIQIPYNCLWKSCRLTGLYCCKVTSCTANTEISQEIMREAGRHFIDDYSDESRIAAIREGNTHTPKLNHNRRIDGHCVFGEEKTDTDPDTGDEHPHIHCHLHERAYANDIPLHYFHSIGPSLFPADILIVDGQWFITAAHERAKNRKITRWWVTSEETICTNHGDTKDFGILQHPDFHALYSDILGRDTTHSIQNEVYGQSGPVEPEIKDGWIRADQRNLTPYSQTCRNCEGDGCDKCDGRGEFVNWQ